MLYVQIVCVMKVDTPLAAAIASVVIGSTYMHTPTLLAAHLVQEHVQSFQLSCFSC